jgi:hypothetical protein
MRSLTMCTLDKVIRVTKLRRMRLAGNVACMGVTRNAYKIFVKDMKAKRPFGRREKSCSIEMGMRLQTE